MPMHLVAGLGLVLCACVGLYLASPHQRLLAQPLTSRPARVAGAVLLLVVGSVLIGQEMQFVAAVFTVLTWVMLLLVLLPYLGVLLSLKRGR
jgi:hypothetical protein